MPAEFGRVFSLLLQRHQQKNIPQYMQLKSIANCLEIKYSDLSETGAEGVFYFDDRVSSANRLVVEVDATYSFTDDLTTAFLLSHELSHARQYTEELQGIKTWNCVDAEVDAFYSQLIFGSLLNEEESDSVISRIEKGSRNSQLLQYEDLLDLSWDAIGACNLANKSNPTQQDLDCYKQTLYQKLRQMVTSNPYYQDQCGITD